MELLELEKEKMTSPLLLVIIPVLITSVSSILLFYFQTRWQNKQRAETALQKFPKENAEAAQIQGLAYQLVIDQLQEQIQTINDDRKQLRKELDQAKKEIIELREENQALNDEFLASRISWDREKTEMLLKITKLEERTKPKE